MHLEVARSDNLQLRAELNVRPAPARETRALTRHWSLVGSSNSRVLTLSAQLHPFDKTRLRVRVAGPVVAEADHEIGGRMARVSCHGFANRID